VARKRYPSDDHRKKQRPHAKVHLTIRSHPRYGEAFEAPESRGIVVGLWVLGVQYHACQDGDEVTLGHGDLTWLTGRTHWAPALDALRVVCESMAYPLRVEGRRVVVGVRNLQRKQGFNSALRERSPRSSANSAAPRSTEEQKYRRTEGRAEKKPSASISAWAQRLSRVLIEKLGTSGPDGSSVPGARFPRGCEQRWAREIEKMPVEIPGLRAKSQDDREKEIEFAIEWAFGPDNLGHEYEVRIRSGKALREKWPKLVANSLSRGQKAAGQQSFQNFIDNGDVEASG